MQVQEILAAAALPCQVLLLYKMDKPFAPLQEAEAETEMQQIKAAAVAVPVLSIAAIPPIALPEPFSSLRRGVMELKILMD